MKTSQNPFDRRNAYMICALTYELNSFLLSYKEQYCPGGYNTEACVAIIDESQERPENRGCTTGDIGCYPLARDVCKSGELREFLLGPYIAG